MPDSASSFFHMPFLYFQHAVYFFAAISTCRIQKHHFQHAVSIISTCLFFLQQFHHAGFSSTILQHAVFHSFNMPFFTAATSTCRHQQHLFSTCRFHSFNMPLVSAAISTCRIQQHNFNMPDSVHSFNMPLVSAAISTCRIQQHHFSTCPFLFLQHAFFLSVAISTCRIQQHHFQHDVFISSKCLFSSVAVSTCSNFWNTPDSAVPIHVGCRFMFFKMPVFIPTYCGKFQQALVIMSTCIVLTLCFEQLFLKFIMYVC